MKTPLLISHEKDEKGPPFTQLFSNYSPLTYKGTKTVKMDPFEPNILRFFIVPHLLATGKANVNAFLQKFLISHLKGTKNAKVKAVLVKF